MHVASFFERYGNSTLSCFCTCLSMILWTRPVFLDLLLLVVPGVASFMGFSFRMWRPKQCKTKTLIIVAGVLHIFASGLFRLTFLHFCRDQAWKT